jgi:hypothetical protein
MYAYDVDGDGDNDVITSLAAHAYGLAWYEQVASDKGLTFKRHLIIGEKPEENEYGIHGKACGRHRSCVVGPADRRRNVDDGDE